MVKKTYVEKFLEELSKRPTDNDKWFLECLIDLDERIKKIEERLCV